MDPLRKHSIEAARATSPSERLDRALDLMAMGLQMKRDQIRRRNPTATEDELQRMFEAWQLSRE